MSEEKIVYRSCPFCEATCGTAISVDGERIKGVRGDREDPFSRGFICPKAYGLKELHADPDRLRKPIKRTPDGWQEIEWTTAYDEITARLLEIREQYGNDSVGMYTGNPVVHDLGALLYRPVFQRALDSRSMFNSSAIDTLPKIVQTGLMFGRQFPTGVPIPDIDRSDFLLIVGANPVVSHGSLMTMPDAPGRLKALQGRGGKLVVVDPRRSETAKLADKHLFLRPGTDALFLLAMVHTLFQEDLVDLGAAEGLVTGAREVESAVGAYAPERVADQCGIEAEAVRTLTREFAAAPSAACYGRLGTCVQEFGTLASWACELLNVLTGNLDRPGGVMFTTPAAPVDAALPKGVGFEIGRWSSRVGKHPEVGGLIPSSSMAEEILTPGEGQVRAMFLLMTNPLRSASNSTQLESAFRQLDLLIAVDFYLNETTSLADYILPTPSAAEHEHYDVGLYCLSVRNVAKWSQAAVAPPPGTPHTWEILANLGSRMMGLGNAELQDIDDLVLRQYVDAAVEDCPWDGLDSEEAIEKLTSQIGPERVVELLLRIGPYGDGFGRNPEGLTLERVKAAPHGIDLGPLEPRLERVINTESGKVELAPALMLGDLERLERCLTRDHSGVLLIGRRDLRSTNSFTHNLPALVKGPDRCTLHLHPSDADRFGIGAGGRARITSRVGSVVAPVEITDDLMPGVVSLPHGWGHNAAGARLSTASRHAGVNTNILTDDQAYDTVSGTAVLFGTPVEITPA